MKALLVGLLAIASVSAFSIDGELDGKKFCRSVTSGGMMGQPAGTRLHCISFKGGRATDNANTFFGNPPQTFTYALNGKKVMNVDTNKKTGYELVNKNLVMKETGRVLKLVK